MKNILILFVFSLITYSSAAQFKQTDSYYHGTAYVASNSNGLITMRLLDPNIYFLTEQTIGKENNLLVPGKKYTVFVKAIPKKENGINAIVILARYHYTTNSTDFLHVQDSISPVLKVKRYN